MTTTTSTSSSSNNGFFSLRSTNNGVSRVNGCGKPNGVAMWFINGVTAAFFASLEHCCIRIATKEDGDDDNNNDDLPLIFNHGILPCQRKKVKGKKR
ncbi:hypothetical protein Fmac_031735 [Flemingia macrophylla]|uniref:Transmembrane protein n=1 Tax=Flemingia macrophylla TaxID=520843 RepID=A0ABD1L2W9_9FABA